MITNLQTIWTAICTAGTYEAQNTWHRNRLQTMNTVYAYVTLMVAIFTCFAMWVDGGTNMFITAMGFISLSSGLIYANHRKYYRTALWLHFLLSGMPALVCSFLIEFGAGFYFYLFTAPISILLFVDRSNKIDRYGAILYYTLMFILALWFHLGNYELRVTDVPNLYFLVINFIFTTIFIAILGLTFVRLNEAHVIESKDKNKILERQRNEIIFANTNLIEKNEEIGGLVKVLNDKVKNNLQIIGFFTELDALAPPTDIIANLFLLQKSRVKVLDIAYAMIFEEKIVPAKRFAVFFDRYYTFIKTNYKTKIAPSASIDLILPPNLPDLDRKRFEMILLLINEWHFGLLNALESPTELHFIVNMILNENDNKAFHLTIKVTAHPVKKMIEHKNIMRLRQPNTTITLDYDTATDAHIFSANF